MGIEVGQVIDGKYRVTSCIGEGGMGAVFAGEHLKLHRRVAIKTLHPSLAQDPEVVGRFEREAQAAGRIGNDHILEVFDIGELPGGDRFMVMEFLDGEAMNTRLQRLGRLSPAQVYPLAKQMLVGLAAAHAAGIVHRDLKPANIFIQREKAGVPDYIKIIDFGISKFRTLAGETHQTRTGTIIGTPAYMSPEQARGLREADARSDIYAIGVIIYETVTGRVPFEGASTNDVLFKIFLNEVPVEALAQSVDPGFCSIVMKALAKDPDDRFARAEDFGAALDVWAQTGRGVAISRSSVPQNTVLEPARPLAPSQPPPAPQAAYVSQGGASPPQVRPTQGSWAESNPRVSGVAGPETSGAGPSNVPGPRSSRAIVAAGVGIALSLIAAGIAVNALRTGHDAPGAAASVSAPASVAAIDAPRAVPTVTATGTGAAGRPPETPPEIVSPPTVAAADAAGAAPPAATTTAPARGPGGANRGRHNPPPGAPTSPPPARATANPLDQL